MPDARTFWKQRIAAWRASGETAKTFCERHGLSSNTLQWWASRIKRDDVAAAATMRWAKVEMAPKARAIVMRVGEVRIAVEAGFDQATLASILDVLDRRGSK